MLSLHLTLTGEVEKFINKASRLYEKPPESVVCDLIAKGYDPEGSVTGADISKAEDPLKYLRDDTASDKPARSA